MILDILTVLFFVLGFALLFWMNGERRGDVLHASRARASMAAGLRAQTSLTKLSRVARYTESESEMSTAGLQELEELEELGGEAIGDRSRAPTGA